MDIQITVKFIIKDACDQAYIDNHGGDTEQERLESAIHELINEECLMAVVELPCDEILEIKKLD